MNDRIMNRQKITKDCKLYSKKTFQVLNKPILTIFLFTNFST